MKGCNGFTLTEIIVALAIMGILTVIAVPIYRDVIYDTRRSDAIQTLLKMQLAQEAYRLRNDSYADSSQMALPASDSYVFNVTQVSPTSYLLSATAINDQHKDSGCEILTLDQALVKTPATCW